MVQETHIRIFLPDPSAEQHMMNDDEMKVMMNVMHGPDADDLPNGLRFFNVGPPPPPAPVSDKGFDVPHFARRFCFRARAALHHLATHPLFMASIILMFISSVLLLVIACYRLSIRRARRATFQRQYRVCFSGLNSMLSLL